MTIRILTDAGDYLISDDGAYLNTEEIVADLAAQSAVNSDISTSISIASASYSQASLVTADLYVLSGLFTNISAEATLISGATTSITTGAALTAESSTGADLSASIQASATLIGQPSASGTLDTGIPLLAAGVADANVLDAPLTTAIIFASDIANVATQTSDITTQIVATSTLVSTPSVTADLRTSIDAFASYIAVANLAGADLSTQVLLQAQQSAEAYSEGLLGSIIEMSGSLYCESALTTNLTTQIATSSATSALSSLSSGLATEINLALTVSVQNTVASDLTTIIQLAADTAQSVSLQSSVTTSINLATAIANNAVFAAELKTSINALTSLIGVSNIADASLTVYRIDPVYAPLDNLIYLAEIQAYDPTTSSVITWRFSSGRGYDNGGVFYPPRIEQPATLKRDMGIGVGGRTSLSYGEMTLTNLDGGLNALADDYFDGRTLTIKRGNPASAYSTFTTLLVATVESVAIERERVSVRLRDKAVTLDQAFSTVTYAGTNALPLGIEGTPDDIMGQMKPRIFGRIALMAPILVNTSKLIYQVNNGAVDNIINVYDAGAYLTRSTDYSSEADMEGNAPASGTWRAWPQGGCFRLGSVSYGQVSVCAAEKWAYSQNTAAGIIQRILTEKGYTSSNWVAADFVALDQKNAGSLGVIVSDSETTSALLDRICQSVGAWWGFDALGRFRVARLDAPSGTPAATLTDNEILQLERQPASMLPVWQSILKSDVNYAKQDKKSLAGVVPANRSVWFENESRDQKVESATTHTTRLLSESQTYDSLLNGISIAQAETSRRLDLFSQRRDLVTLTVANPSNLLSSIDLGSVIQIKTHRLGYDAGRLMTVTGVQVDIQANQLDLTVWG